MLTTRCNRCSTEFVVTREQLSARAGRVRCGQCQTLFNALETLTQREAATGTTRDERVSLPPTSVSPTAVPQTFVPPSSDHAPLEPLAPVQPALAPPAVFDPRPFTPRKPGAAIDITAPFDNFEALPDPPAPPLPQIATPLAPVEAEPAAKDPFFDWPPLEANTTPAPDPAAQLATLDTPPPAQVAPLTVPGRIPAATAAPAASTRIQAPAPAGATSTQATSTQATAAAATFDFGPQPEEKKSNGWWVFLALLLFLTLLGQALFYFRGAIALLVPEAKPYIVQFCAEVGCEVPLPRRVELVTIESSDLQADPANPGVMVLLATLRNRAAFPQAFPALELTLTNERDQALARRVLQHTDYLVEKAEAFDGSSERQIRVYVEASALKPSGYRLYLFYP